MGSEHFDVHDEDEFEVDEWTPDVRILIEGFDEVFLAESLRAADRATEAMKASDAPGVAGATGAAVLLATAACEARLSEFVSTHETSIGAAAVDEIRRPSRDRGDAAKQWRLLLANRASTFDCENSHEFKALRCLFVLRDLVAHRGARHLRLGEWPEQLTRYNCIAEKTIPVDETDGVDWTSAVYVQRVALWAAETAQKWLAVASGLGIG
ncbi:MAG TPA: hypothetical protein VIV83_07575 [Gemmatimonadales bacterium]|jgi:hypothetical protein